MRRPLIVGNWKMNLNRAEAVRLVEELKPLAARMPGADLVVCPPFVYIDAVRGMLAETAWGWGAQDMAHQENGAFTGEISAAMLVDLGCKYVILGHSERRHVFGETDAEINKKTLAALAAGLTPIVCVGELLAEREAGQTGAVIRKQFEESLAELSAEQMVKAVIAYEPVWAIGTGKVATPEQAEEVHRDLRKLLASRYNAATAEAVRIQYGGSVKPGNAASLLQQPNIDGALVGGACLTSADFGGIIAAAG